MTDNRKPAHRMRSGTLSETMGNHDSDNGVVQFDPLRGSQATAARDCIGVVAVPPVVPHQRLLSQSMLHGTEEILRNMPAEHSPELEQAIRYGVRQAVLYYAEGLDAMSRQPRPLDHARSARA